jgi:hypothetical protein
MWPCLFGIGAFDLTTSFEGQDACAHASPSSLIFGFVLSFITITWALEFDDINQRARLVQHFA